MTTVVISTHNPHPGRLARALDGLQAQTLPLDQWECLLIDNASTSPIQAPGLTNCRVIRETQLGLTYARRCGLREARGEWCVLVDDDNVLAPDYLEQVARLFAHHPKLGAMGGRSLPEFESAPPAWAAEFFPLLALRDGSSGLSTAGLRRSPDGTHFLYPACSPIGAGMALRRDAAITWAEAIATDLLPDRRGTRLTSGGDNDIVLTLLHAGWEVGYFPELTLTHLIPSFRLDADYLARLNRGIQCSWMQVLSRHGANGWPAIAGWTLPLRILKTWWGNRAWRGPAERIRWQGAWGHFEGRVR